MFTGGVNTAGAKGSTYADCLEIWSLNLLEPSGLVQACIGIALPFSQKRAVIFPTTLALGVETKCTLRYVEFLFCLTNKYFLCICRFNIVQINIRFFDVLLTVLHLSTFISVINQLDAQNLFRNMFYFMPLHVSSTCAHHQEVKIALHSLWYHHTYRCDDTRGIKLVNY